MAKKSALPFIAGGAALLLLSSQDKRKRTAKSSGKSRWGIQVSPDCKTVNVVDAKLFNRFMLGAFNELVETDPSLTLIQMTDALFGDVAPNCRGFPEDPQSAEVAELYATIARSIFQFMVGDPRIKASAGEMIDEATQISFVDWYRAWRNYPSSDIPEAPDDQVSFSSDLSTFYIGTQWYPKTVVPFVAEAAKNGEMDIVFKKFTNERNVLVGQFTTPIDELPQDEVAVVEFLDKLEEAIVEAKKEIGP